MVGECASAYARLDVHGRASVPSASSSDVLGKVEVGGEGPTTGFFTFHEEFSAGKSIAGGEVRGRSCLIGVKFAHLGRIRR